MKLKELKEYVNKIPSEYEEYDVTKSQVLFSNIEKNIFITSETISTINIDTVSKEIQIFHQTDEDIKKLFNNGATKKS